MTRPYRVLVTGSRGWCNCRAITDAIDHAFTAADERMIVIHGACPTGADWHADHYASSLRDLGLPIDVERHPAQNHPTQDFGPWPAAGPKRNAHMIGLGADLCLAFIGPCTSPRCRKPGPHPSRGATHTADLAEKAGIPTRRWTA